MTQTFKSNSCKYLGQEVNWSHSWWCSKQFAEPTEIHKKCDCGNCPDFEAIEWTMESTDSNDYNECKRAD